MLCFFLRVICWSTHCGPNIHSPHTQKGTPSTGHNDDASHRFGMQNCLPNFLDHSNIEGKVTPCVRAVVEGRRAAAKQDSWSFHNSDWLTPGTVLFTSTRSLVSCCSVLSLTATGLPTKQDFWSHTANNETFLVHYCRQP